MGAGGSIAFRAYLCPLKRKRANPDPEISEDRSHGDMRDLESERCRPHAAAVATARAHARAQAHCRTGNWCGGEGALSGQIAPSSGISEAFADRKAGDFRGPAAGKGRFSAD